MQSKGKPLFFKDEKVFANALLQGYEHAVILAKKLADCTK